MQWLPKLTTTAGVFALPLSGRAAERLVAALIAGPSSECDRQLVGDALEHDAPLALWCACRAAERTATSPRTIDELADWLAGAALDELNWPLEPEEAPNVLLDKSARLFPPSPLTGEGRGEGGAFSIAPAHPSPLPQGEREHHGDREPGKGQLASAPSATDAWAALAARSLGVARLARRLAAHAAVDPQRAYALGLLHAAGQWLASAAGERSPAATSDVLPAWLRDELHQVARAVARDVSSPSGCVATALRMTDSAAADEWRSQGLGFDFEAHHSQIAAARHNWSQPSHPGLLPRLVEKLGKLQKLTGQFQQTLEAEKLDSLKELAYGAGHEINNPLANISARAQTLLPQERDPDRRRMLASIHTQALRAHEMIADMMLFARPPQPKLEPIDLAALLGGLRDELASQAAGQQTQLTLAVSKSPLTVWADKTQIAVAVRALCANALEALVTRGHVEIALIESAPLHDAVQITVSDSGPGISREARRHIFDPFYSGREAGRGLGFGLSKCWRIVTMHGGRVDVESPGGSGTRFTITLPMLPKS